MLRIVRLPLKMQVSFEQVKPIVTVSPPQQIQLPCKKARKGPAASISALLLCSLLFACTEMESSGPSDRLSYGPFSELRIYRTQLPAQHLALLLSGDGGWGGPLPEIARRLSDAGTLVAGIYVRDLFSSYTRDPQSCVSPGADLANLAHDLGQRYALHGLDDTVCPAAQAREFVGGVPDARFIGVPGMTHSYHHLNRWWPAFEAAWRQLTGMNP